MALGFHVRSHNREFTDDGGTDIRQVWWAIFSLESFLEKMTGHPGSFLRDVTPFILEPEPNFLNAYTRLMCLTHEMIDQVYRPDPNLRSENQMRTTVLEFNNKLEDWARNLPGDLIFISKQPREGFNNPQMYLAFAYYSSQMVLFRPLDLLRDSQQPSKASPISNISRASGTAARQMMSLLPEVKVVEKTPGYESTLKLSPWYCLIQYLLQAITVLMIEMVATRDDSERIQAFDAAIRSLRWLHILTKNHGPGSGSYRQADILLRHATSYLGLSLPLDLPPSPSELGSDEIHVHGDEYFHPHLNRPGDVPMYGSAGDFTGTNNPFPRSSYHESMEYDMEPEDTATGGFLQSYGYETFG